MPATVPLPALASTPALPTTEQVDAYVAAMKGVILSINPAATLVDISHAIPPQDIRQGALVLAEATPWFPPQTIHVAVVDPGVGSSRKIVYAMFARADQIDCATDPDRAPHGIAPGTEPAPSSGSEPVDLPPTSRAAFCVWPICPAARWTGSAGMKQYFGAKLVRFY